MALRPSLEPQRQAGARDRCGAVRSVGRLPSEPSRPRGGDPGLRRGDGRDDALRDPGLPAAPRSAHRRTRADRGDGRARDLQTQGRGLGRRARGGRFRRGLRRGRRAPFQAGRHPGPRCRPDRRRRLVPAQRRLRREAGDRPARGRLRRRQHGDGRRPGRPPDGRGRGAHRLPAHPRADARPSRRGGGRRAGGRADPLAAHDHDVRRSRSCRSS